MIISKNSFAFLSPYFPEEKPPASLVLGKVSQLMSLLSSYLLRFSFPRQITVTFKMQVIIPSTIFPSSLPLLSEYNFSFAKSQRKLQYVFPQAFALFFPLPHQRPFVLDFSIVDFFSKFILSRHDTFAHIPSLKLFN